MLDVRGEWEGSAGDWPAPGSQVAGFTLQECLATGSSGCVYRAERGGRRFALKLVPMGHWGEREVDALRRVRHTSVVGLLGYGQWPEDTPRFLVLTLEWVDGPPLDVWARDTACTARQCVERVVLPVVDALGQVHAAGVVHRDVKEANIVMRREDGRPVLVDFGAAAFQGAPRLTMRLPPGTPEYRSPEMWRFAREWNGEPYASQPADDLWALGVTLYVLLTRALPFGDRHGALVRTVLEQAPEPPQARNPRVPPTLGALCLRMLEKAPGDRYADAPALTHALREALARADDTWDVPLFTLEPPREAPPPPRPPARRDGRGALTLALLVSLFLLPSPRYLPSEKGSAAPPARSTRGIPSQQAGFRQELADVAKTAEVGPRAELFKSPPPAPAPKPHREDEPMRKSPPRRSLTKATLLSAACMSAACASAPAPRPVIPTECPPGSEDTLRRFGITMGELHRVFMVPTIEVGRSKDKFPIKEGPWAVDIYAQWGDIPSGSELHGVVYVDNNRLQGRFTRLRPSGMNEDFPVCMKLTYHGYPGQALEPESRPGKPVVEPMSGVRAVDIFR